MICPVLSPTAWAITGGVLIIGATAAKTFWDERFPGFGHDTHGVENREGDYYVQCLRKGSGPETETRRT